MEWGWVHERILRKRANLHSLDWVRGEFIGQKCECHQENAQWYAKTGEDGKSGLTVKAIRTALIARWNGREKCIEGKKQWPKAKKREESGEDLFEFLLLK